MSDSTATNLPLAGLTILEMGSSVAGPFAGRIFGDFGANLWKVEPPGVGDAARGWGQDRLGGEGVAFQAFNRDKRSITVGFARLRRLIVEKVDVVFQNLPPGAVAKFGLDGPTLMAEDPRLIYCNMGAYGPSGPLQDAPGYDPLIQAFSGIADATGEAAGDAVRVGVPLIDMGTGMWAVIGILSALHRRFERATFVVRERLVETLAQPLRVLVDVSLHSGDPNRLRIRRDLVGVEQRPESMERDDAAERSARFAVDSAVPNETR